MPEEEKLPLKAEFEMFKTDVKADLFILKEQFSVLIRDFGKNEQRICKAEKDIDGLGATLRRNMEEMHRELSDDIIERTKSSNTRLFDFIKIGAGALIGALVGHLVKK